jgi:23S rRNA pseudouridine2457 synthase
MRQLRGREGMLRVREAWDPMLIALHKPWGVVSRFSRDASPHRTLADFGLPPGVYPIGRLDAESEGLLLLSDEKALVDRLLHPRHRHPRTYWAQVEGRPSEDALRRLARGVVVAGRPTLPCSVREIEPALPPRVPDIRLRKSVPTAWLELELVEGRNRQVRRMTAAVGLPTLRLVRVRIGALPLGELASGSWEILGDPARRLALRTGSGPRKAAKRQRGES